MRIAVIGATGLLGRELVAALAASDAPAFAEPPLLFATGRSAGEALAWRAEDEDLPVEEYAAEALRGCDAAVLAVPPDVAASLAPALRAAGVAALDASRAHRAQAPLWRPGADAAALARAPLVALPGPESWLLARALAPLAAWRPAWVRATVLRPASGAGAAGVEELGEGARRLLGGEEPDTARFAHRLAFNLVPQAGRFEGPDTEAERDLAAELPALLGRPVRAAATVAWAPWFYGAAVFATAGFEAPGDAAAARALLHDAPGVKVLDRPEESVYPLPSLATGDEAVLVGRLRADPVDPGALAFAAAADVVAGAAALARDALAALAAVRGAR